MPDSRGPARVRGIQLAPALGDVAGNADRVVAELEAAAAAGAHLAVFPEAMLSGYVFERRSEALEAAVTRDHPALRRISEACGDTGAWAVFGGLERSGGRLFNAAFLCGPDRPVAVYRKLHTLCLGVDRFTIPGDSGFAVYDLPFGRVGVNICYDGTFPESARALKLLGAQLVVLVTNWPNLHLKLEQTRMRALDNHVFYLAVNRVGEERGVVFPGGSAAADPRGELLARLGDEPGRIDLALDLAAADRTHVVVRPGAYEFDYVADRRPDAYGPLLEPPTGERTGSRRSAEAG
jgi:predicted amidohydrolase